MNRWMPSGDVFRAKVAWDGHFLVLERKLFLGSACVLLLLLVVVSPQFFSHPRAIGMDYDAGTGADRIVLTWQTDPTTSQAVTWRTADDDLPALVEFAPANATPEVVEDVRRVRAQTSRLVTANGPARYHTVNLTGLKPATLYAYRVGDGANWSEWFQFKTASDRVEPFTFVYFGDVQRGIGSHWSRLIRSAFLQAPDAAFMIHAGDLTSRGGRNHDDEWGEWFSAGGWIHAMVPSIPAVGNHEYQPDSFHNSYGLSPHWSRQFALPFNGPPGLERTVYYVDYQGVRIIVLDSEHALNSGSAQMQTRWMELLLRHNTNRWTIVVYHHSTFAPSSKHRAAATLTEVWDPLFQRYGVDLVLQGHDHVYAREMSLNRDSEDQEVGIGPIYVVSVAGAKMYSLEEGAEENLDRVGEGKQFYQIVEVHEELLRYKAYTATNRLYDAFEIHQDHRGRKRLVEEQDSELILGEERSQ